MYSHLTQFETLDRRARERARVEAPTRQPRSVARLLRRPLRPRPLRAPQCA